MGELYCLGLGMYMCTHCRKFSYGHYPSNIYPDIDVSITPMAVKDKNGNYVCVDYEKK